MQSTNKTMPVILNSPPLKGVRLLNWKRVFARLGHCNRSEFYRKVHRGRF